MKFVRTLMVAALCSTAISTPVWAQEAESQTSESFDDDNVIIVTATRRAEDVQDIPIAVTAVTPQQLERQGVVSVGQITNVSSSFSTSSAQTASGSVVLRIRGVGTTSNNIGFESAVGIFVDGAYQSRPGVALSEFVDVERVEVLRGPQGTLFGRNTSAGALNITNVRPDLEEFGGFANATYGNRDWINLQGAVNVPIVQDALAFRLTGAYSERDGYLTVVDRNGNRVGESNGQDQYLIRGQLGFETDSGISGRIIADYAESTAGVGAALEVLQSPVETAGLFAAVGLGARGGMAGPAVAVGPFDVTNGQAAADSRIATANFAPVTSFDQWGITAEVEVPISDSADLIYIGSYREYDALERFDLDFSGLDAATTGPQITTIETMTHELRVQGEAFDGALSWLVGAYYSEEDIFQSLTHTLGSEYDALIGALFFAPTGGVFGNSPLSILSGGVSPAGTSNTNQFSQNSSGWSIFTHNVLEVADGLDLTIGLRYSDETKDGAYTQINNNAPNCNAIVGAIVGGLVPAPLVNNALGTGCFVFIAPADLPQSAVLPLPRTFAGEFNDDELIYTGKISYAFSDPVNIYASFTHGYKSGGFNLDATGAVLANPAAVAAGAAPEFLDPRFLSEEVDAYEIGLKGKFLDNAITLNVAAFLEEFSNFQVLEFTGGRFQTFNVPKAETIGVEIETTIRPSDNFTFNGALTYTDAKYPNDCAGNQTNVNVLALCGNSLTNAPTWVGIAGATYNGEIGNNLKFFLNGQLRFESDRRTSTQAVDPLGLLQTPPVFNPVPFDVQDGNVKINLRAGLGDIDDAWGIEAFVTNLTNEVTRGVTFNTVLRTGSRSAFIQEPRSYGLTVRGKF